MATDITSAFQFADAEVILRPRAEFKEFKVHRWPLQQASPVYRSTFGLPQPPNPQGTLPVIVVEESAAVTCAILSFIYPNIDDPPLTTDLDIIPDLLRALDKYEMSAQLNRVISILESLAQTEPVRVFLIARSVGLDDIALTAAHNTLRIPWENLMTVNVPEQNTVPSGASWELLRYHQRCGQVAAAVIHEKTLNIILSSVRPDLHAKIGSKAFWESYRGSLEESVRSCPDASQVTIPKHCKACDSKPRECKECSERYINTQFASLVVPRLKREIQIATRRVALV
ncbi:hypothetical protein K474DRAFT_1624101 [Panus rudis PR-1116 ss-1]|nr:hypothetical protein K474DRAFT_1624101 [Panus rudis PR-1116 ss-1]